MWGSATFILGTFAAGLLLDAVSPGDLIWLIAGAALLAAVCACVLLPLPASAALPAAKPAAAKPLLRDRAFLTVIAAVSLVQASHAVYYGFSAIDWRAAGLDATLVAALWALGVIAEIMLFAFSARLPEALDPLTLIRIGAAGATLRWGVMALDPPHLLLPALQVLHALSFGATHLGAISFLAQRAPPGVAASAQAGLSIALGIGMAAAMAVSGGLYAVSGAWAYAAMALLAAAGAVMAGLVGRRR
jgi:PPP family 3-phenylpropionic acid transporter